MKIKEIMTPNVEIVDFHVDLQEAAAKMKDLNVGVLPVRQGDQIVGMLTDRDITVRAVAEGRDPKGTRVVEIMTVGLVFCYENDDVAEAAQIMAEQQIRRLPVLNHQNKLVGIVSLGDLAVDGANDNLMGKTLEEISEPAQPVR